MLSNIKLLESDALAETELRELGKINVICGKNNSGKSTLLWALSADKIFPGTHVSTADADQIAQKSLIDNPWRGLNFMLDDEYRECVRRVLGTKELWWSADREEFYERLTAQLQESESFRYLGRPLGPPIVGAFLGIFPERTVPALIPAKRSLELESELGIPLRDTGGRGILSELFVAKNQLPGDAKHVMYEAVSDAFQEITGGHSFDISLGREQKLVLSFRTPANRWFPAAQSGLGFHEPIVLVYHALEPSSGLLLVEEPENHLHPQLQRRLLRFWRENTSKQFVVTTHSNIFLDINLVDRVFYTRATDRIEVDDATSRAAILNDLGYEVTDNLVSDLVILVEGPSDVAALQPLISKLGLSERIIKLWPLGGDIMGQLDLSIFAEKYRIIALIDADPGSARVRRQFVKLCEQLGIPVYRLERYSLENYFSVRAIRHVLKGQISPELQELPPDKPVEKAIGINIKNNNRRIAEAMDLQELLGTDLDAFLQRVALESGNSLYHQPHEH